LSLLLVLSSKPYDGTDVAWNALRLADKALDAGMAVRLFLINDGVDVARPRERGQIEFDLAAMLQDLAGKGAEVRLCSTCIQRCGITSSETIAEAQVAGMDDLVEWVGSSEKVLSF
jgi:uncharacterized protein involved in oxidation of intracellular sulfur